jgi:hypothetical protein
LRAGEVCVSLLIVSLTTLLINTLVPAGGIESLLATENSLKIIIR